MEFDQRKIFVENVLKNSYLIQFNVIWIIKSAKPYL